MRGHPTATGNCTWNVTGGRQIVAVYVVIAGRPHEQVHERFFHAELFDSHRTIYRTTIGRRGEITVGRMIRRMLRDLMRDDIAAAALPQSSAQVDMTTEYVVGALWATVVWWMTSQPTLSATEVNDSFRRLVFNGIAA